MARQAHRRWHSRWGVPALGAWLLCLALTGRAASVEPAVPAPADPAAQFVASLHPQQGDLLVVGTPR